MKFKLLFFAVLLLLIVSPTFVQGATWISISGMVFVGDADILMYKYEGISSYLTLDTTYGSAWAQVNFPPNSKGKKVVRMDATVYDGLDAMFGILDVANIRIDLIKVELATGLIKGVMAVGTGYMGAPGLVTLSDTTGTDAQIDNKKWAWYLKCTVELSGNRDDLRLYGVRIRYK